ncbi:hypothetical protein RHGRI_017399 [Rhododendron griersonianum]|uniref:Uncharacterized protein n=1 Tax=Rhododendron griersonianum TaxID=479676 RepID=A0AAV6JXW6_9ERIC|nr:hypothetical protein RHGRI_017399 [Rhododendron griersonianum]
MGVSIFKIVTKVLLLYILAEISAIWALSSDDLVDEDTEGNSTFDLLLERTREQGLVDLVIPSLVLLVNLLQKLQTLIVMQDMLRVFIICIACLNADHACLLLRPIISWVRDRISMLSSLPDTDAYKVLPVGRELLACLSTFKELCSSSEWKSVLDSLLLHIQSSRNEECDVDGRYERDGSDNLLNTFEWRKSPPLLCYWITLLRYLDSKDIVPEYAVEAVDALSSGALCFCMDGISLNLDRVSALKSLFGLPFNTSGADDFLE